MNDEDAAMAEVNRRRGCWAYRTHVSVPCAVTRARVEARYAITDGPLRQTFLGSSWAEAMQRWSVARGAAFGSWGQRGLA